MTYNDLFTKENILNTLQTMFTMNIAKHPLIVKKATVSQPKYTFDECTRYNLLYNYTIKYELSLSGTKEKAKGVLSIPKMHNGGFYVLDEETMNGFFRVPINSAKVDRPIAIFNANIAISKCCVLENVAKRRGQSMLVYNKKSYPLKEYFEEFGVDVPAGVYAEEGENRDEEVTDVDWDFDGNLITTDPRVNISFNYYFGYYLEKTKTIDENTCENVEAWIITPSNVRDVIELCHQHREYLDTPSIFDFKFITPTQSFIDYLKANKKLQDSIRTQYFRNKNKIKPDYAQRHIEAYFKMQSKITTDLHGSTDSNAIDLLDQTRKIFFRRKKERIPITYTRDLIGIIDPVETHEGQYTSIRNALCRDCILKEDGNAYVRVMDKKGKIVELSAIDHFNSKILSITSYDYEKQTLLLNKHGKIKILYRAEFFEVEPDEENYDYLRPSPYSTLSYNSSVIPRLNSVDSVRGAMSTAMTGQAIPVIGALPNIVCTGIEELVYRESGMNIRAEEDGMVVGVLDGIVKILGEHEKLYYTPRPLKTASNTTNLYRPIVAEGQEVKKGDIIIASNSFIQKQLALSVPLRIAYASFFGFEFEDGMVVSKSAALKLGHLSFATIQIPVFRSQKYEFDKEVLLSSPLFNPEDQVFGMNELNEVMLPDIGDEVYPGKLLFAYLYEPDIDSENMKLHKGLAPDKQIYRKSLTKVPRYITNGKVVNVEVITTETKRNPLKKVREYYANIKKEKNKTLENFIGESVYETHQNNFVPEDCIALITISIEYTNILKEGDKVSNRFGSKGLVTKIVPDEEMPKLEDGSAVEVIMSPHSVVNRKNTAQLNEIFLGSASVKAWQVNDGLLRSGENIEEVCDNLNILYATKDFKGWNKEVLMKFHRRYQGYYQLKVLPYDTKYTETNLRAIANHFGLRLSGLQTLTYPNGRKTRQPVVCGITSIERLHFIVEDKARVTSKKPTWGNLVLGMGSARKLGQKIGTQEVSAILAHGTPQLLTELNKSKVDHKRQILQQFWALGLDLVELPDDND